MRNLFLILFGLYFTTMAGAATYIWYAETEVLITPAQAAQAANYTKTQLSLSIPSGDIEKIDFRRNGSASIEVDAAGRDAAGLDAIELKMYDSEPKYLLCAKYYITPPDAGHMIGRRAKHNDAGEHQHITQSCVDISNSASGTIATWLETVGARSGDMDPSFRIAKIERGHGGQYFVKDEEQLSGASAPAGAVVQGVE